MKRTMNRSAMAMLAAMTVAQQAAAQMALSGQDAKAVLDNGVVRTVPNAAPDGIALLDLSATPPRLIATIAAPHSVAGPPLSVALTPDERLGLVTSAQRLDPADPSRMIPDNRLSVLDLRATPPAVVQVLETGAGPSGVSVNRAGTLALVANRNAGSVSVFRIADNRLAPVGVVSLGAATIGVSHVQFTRDGRHALATRDGDSMVTVLRVEGETVSPAGRDITVGVRPYGLAITPDGLWAAVANIGRSTGDADTVSLVSLAGDAFRTMDTISVGATPEGIQVSPDNRHVAVTVMNGSNRAAGHPLRGAGQVVVLRIDQGRLITVASAEVGGWAQGVAFNTDGTRLFVQNMVEREIQVLDFDGARLTARPERLRLEGGPSALRTAERQGP